MWICAKFSISKSSPTYAGQHHTVTWKEKFRFSNRAFRLKSHFQWFKNRVATNKGNIPEKNVFIPNRFYLWLVKCEKNLNISWIDLDSRRSFIWLCAFSSWHYHFLLLLLILAVYVFSHSLTPCFYFLLLFRSHQIDCDVQHFDHIIIKLRRGNNFVVVVVYFRSKCNVEHESTAIQRERAFIVINIEWERKKKKEKNWYKNQNTLEMERQNN